MREYSCIITNANEYLMIPAFIVMIRFINFCSKFEYVPYDLILIKGNRFINFMESFCIFRNIIVFEEGMDLSEYIEQIHYKIKNNESGKRNVNGFFERSYESLGMPYYAPMEINDISCVEGKFINAIRASKQNNLRPCIIISMNMTAAVNYGILEEDLSGFIVINIGDNPIPNTFHIGKAISFDGIFALLSNSIAAFLDDSYIVSLAVFMRVHCFVNYNSCTDNSVIYDNEKVTYMGRTGWDRNAAKRAIHKIARLRIS